jgi:hypothetical protein
MLLKVPLFFDWTVDMATSSSITFPYEERLVYNASRSVYENKKALDNVYSCEKNIERQPSYNVIIINITIRVVKMMLVSFKRINSYNIKKHNTNISLSSIIIVTIK